MIDHAPLRARAAGTIKAQRAVVQRAVGCLQLPPLSESCTSPRRTIPTAASDAGTTPPASLPPSGSAVEAGRPANPQSDPGDQFDCAVCSSDLAGIVPCARSEDER